MRFEKITITTESTENTENSKNSKTSVPSVLSVVYSRRGFSLLEMMVVLVLIGLLAAIVTANVRHYMARGKQNIAKVEVRTICDAVEAFNLAYGRYPSNEEGLAVLTQKTDKLTDPPLRQNQLTDPWGKPYQYNQPGRNNEPFEVISYGADGREGGSGEDADIISWQLKQ